MLFHGSAYWAKCRRPSSMPFEMRFLLIQVLLINVFVLSNEFFGMLSKHCTNKILLLAVESRKTDLKQSTSAFLSCCLRLWFQSFDVFWHGKNHGKRMKNPKPRSSFWDRFSQALSRADADAYSSIFSMNSAAATPPQVFWPIEGFLSDTFKIVQVAWNKACDAGVSRLALVQISEGLYWKGFWGAHHHVSTCSASVFISRLQMIIVFQIILVLFDFLNIWIVCGAACSIAGT